MPSTYISEPYQFDSETPYWRSNVDIAGLVEAHHQPGAVEMMTERAMIDPDDTAGLAQFVLMTGRFLPLLSNNVTYCFTFTPGIGNEQAIVLPIVESGTVVDLLAVSADDSSLWGCVTGRGGMAGSFTVGKPVRVYQQPWRWLLYGCDGVVILSKAAFSPKPFNIGDDGSVNRIWPVPEKLADCSAIFAESMDHAESLLYWLFERPIYENSHPALANQLLGMADRAVKDGEKRIAIDTERDDIDAEMLSRAISKTVQTMKREGLLS